MNTLPKSLTFAFLALSIFISGLSADLVGAQSSAPEPMVTLTPEEQAWLKAHPNIQLCLVLLMSVLITQTILLAGRSLLSTKSSSQKKLSSHIKTE